MIAEALKIRIILKECIEKNHTHRKYSTLDSSKLKEFADDNFTFDEMKAVEMSGKECGKRGNCSLRAISPFPTVFSKTCISDK